MRPTTTDPATTCSTGNTLTPVAFDCFVQICSRRFVLLCFRLPLLSSLLFGSFMFCHFLWYVCLLIQTSGTPGCGPRPSSDVGLGEYASGYDLTDDNNNAWIVRTPSPPPTVVPATPPASTPGFHASYTRPESNAPPTSTNSTPRDSTSVTSRLSSFFTGKRTSSPPASDSSPLGQDDGGWRRGPLAGVSGAVEGDASALWAALEVCWRSGSSGGTSAADQEMFVSGGLYVIRDVS